MAVLPTKCNGTSNDRNGRITGPSGLISAIRDGGYIWIETV